MPTRAGGTARGDRPFRARVTLPPPAPAELSTGYRGTRRGAPVSDRPGTSSFTGRSETDAGRGAAVALVAAVRTPGTVKKDLGRSVAGHLGQHKDLGRSVAGHLGRHPDGRIFASLPRTGQVDATRVLAERRDSRAASDGPDTVAAFTSVAPVTHASGRIRGVFCRWDRGKRRRQAVTTFAVNGRRESAWAADISQRARDRDMDHPHAVRILARA